MREEPRAQRRDRGRTGIGRRQRCVVKEKFGTQWNTRDNFISFIIHFDFTNFPYFLISQEITKAWSSIGNLCYVRLPSATFILFVPAKHSAYTYSIIYVWMCVVYIRILWKYSDINILCALLNCTQWSLQTCYYTIWTKTYVRVCVCVGVCWKSLCVWDVHWKSSL